jgi:hypothetical protein
MQDVIDSVGIDRAKEILIYYFSLPKGGHPLQFFFYNFDRMDASITEVQKDKERRRLLLEETKHMVERGGIE